MSRILMRFVDLAIYVAAFLTLITTYVMAVQGGMAEAVSCIVFFGGITAVLFFFRQKVDPR